MKKLHTGVLMLALTVGVFGCKNEAPPPAPAPAPQAQVQTPSAPAPVAVANVALGKALGPDKKIASPTDAFAKDDTIYAVVETTGTGTATLRAKWTYHRGDQTAAVNESSQTISASGPAASEFHISKPDGWPTGDYQVEISLNDKPVSTKKFVVK